MYGRFPLCILEQMSNCSQSSPRRGAVAIEIPCKEMARAAVGAERQRDENTANEQKEVSCLLK